MTQAQSPFHAGERRVQERLGVREKVEAFARRVVRDHMPDQHREFYEMLPFVLVGAVDGRGQPWASLVAGGPGFMTSPDPRTLEIRAAPPAGDPLRDVLAPGVDVGLLGIELGTRRRNRLTGRVRELGPDGFVVEVRQAFGNCPQYIQTRAVEFRGSTRGEPSVSHTDRFDRHTRGLIENSDTLFIATAYGEDTEAWSHGADVSHRGGRPGFVSVEDEQTFVFPDFSGNNHFNTVGNLVLNPRAGFLFLDFDTGDVVYVTGEAEIAWEGPEVAAFAGAERFIRCRARQVIHVRKSLPLRFDFGEFSPMLEHTGSWEQAEQTLAAERDRNAYLPYEVFDIQSESEIISSFYLRRADGKALAGYEPGQFLPLRLAIPGREAPVMRNYTVSDAPNPRYYRLSIKQEGPGALASNFFHDQVRRGFRLEAMAPRGKFILDRTSERPVVLISAGVGITPMLAMANFMLNEGRRTRRFRRAFFIHGTRNSRVQAFATRIRELDAAWDTFHAHICYSAPGEGDRVGKTHDSEGHIDIALLQRVLPFDDYDFYLCGPGAFMRSLYEGLCQLGVREERIRYESFGPATVLEHGEKDQSGPGRQPSAGPVEVRFARSNIELEWSVQQGTLLELAEAAGIDAPFSCRTGICGTCATRIRRGAVDYTEEPTAPRGPDEVLICCSTPRSVKAESCGQDCGVVLEL